MKRLFSIFCALTLCVSLAACGGDSLSQPAAGGDPGQKFQVHIKIRCYPSQIDRTKSVETIDQFID